MLPCTSPLTDLVHLSSCSNKAPARQLTFKSSCSFQSFVDFALGVEQWQYTNGTRTGDDKMFHMQQQKGSLNVQTCCLQNVTNLHLPPLRIMYSNHEISTTVVIRSDQNCAITITCRSKSLLSCLLSYTLHEAPRIQAACINREQNATDAVPLQSKWVPNKNCHDYYYSQCNVSLIHNNNDIHH